MKTVNKKVLLLVLHINVLLGAVFLLHGLRGFQGSPAAPERPDGLPDPDRGAHLQTQLLHQPGLLAQTQQRRASNLVARETLSGRA